MFIITRHRLPGKDNNQANGNQGGVAIILPPRFIMVNTRVLVPGLAIEIAFRGPQDTADRTS